MEIDMTNNNSNSNNNQIITSQYENSPSSFQSEKKPAKKRRSKKDPNGRMFICQCGKGYLSKLALNNHTKSKHQNILFTSKTKNFSRYPQNIFFHTPNVVNGNNNSNLENQKKKRGRPKKSYDILCNDELFYNTFFEHIKRKKQNNSSSLPDNKGINSSYYDLIEKIIKEIFPSIYIEHNSYCSLNNISNSKEHPFLIRLLSNNELLSNGKKVQAFLSCDDIFIKYLKFIYDHSNEQYFKFSIIFVLLLRECINKYKNIELENTKEILNDKFDNSKKEFTQIYDGEQIPEICNEFLTEFLTSANFFGMNTPEYKNEFRTIIQHFCFWLYENNFTSAKLIVNNKND